MPHTQYAPLTCPVRVLVCDGCGTQRTTCVCGLRHRSVHVAVCGACTATGGEPVVDDETEEDAV